MGRFPTLQHTNELCLDGGFQNRHQSDYPRPSRSRGDAGTRLVLSQSTNAATGDTPSGEHHMSILSLMGDPPGLALNLPSHLSIAPFQSYLSCNFEEFGACCNPPGLV